MRILCFLILGALLLIMQTTLFQVLPPWLGRPDPLFILVVFVAYRLNIFQGALLVFCLGLITDIFSGVFLGMYPIVYLLVFLLLKVISQYITTNESVYQIPLAAVSYLLSFSGIFIASSLLAVDNPPEWAWGQVLLQILLLLVIGIPCFIVFDFILTLLSKKEFIKRFLRPSGGNRFSS